MSWVFVILLWMILSNKSWKSYTFSQALSSLGFPALGHSTYLMSTIMLRKWIRKSVKHTCLQEEVEKWRNGRIEMNEEEKKLNQSHLYSVIRLFVQEIHTPQWQIIWKSSAQLFHMSPHRKPNQLLSEICMCGRGYLIPYKKLGLAFGYSGGSDVNHITWIQGSPF
jgi:hypothetical protein